MLSGPQKYDRWKNCQLSRLNALARNNRRKELNGKNESMLVETIYGKQGKVAWMRRQKQIQRQNNVGAFLLSPHVSSHRSIKYLDLPTPTTQVTAPWIFITPKLYNSLVRSWTILILSCTWQLQWHCHHGKDCQAHANKKDVIQLIQDWSDECCESLQRSDTKT